MFRILLYATIGLLFMSCLKTVPYSLKIQEKHHLSVADLKELQFYLSDQVVLYRVNPKNRSAVINGGLYTSSTHDPERVVIKAGTPGKAVLTSANRLGVSFESGSDRFLVFGTNIQDGTYYLQAKNWENGHGIVKYGDSEWFVAPGSGTAHLTIEVKKMKRPYQATTILEGRTK